MKITKNVNGYTTTYFYDGTRKYEHYKDSQGSEHWAEYSTNGNQTHYKNSEGYEEWFEYDPDGNQTHYKNSEGYEEWREYDVDGNVISYKDSTGYTFRKNAKPKTSIPVDEDDIKPFQFQ